MPVQMDPVQLAFWRELLAPFRDDELSQVPARGGNRTLTYVDKRAIENRLDSVCGPHGWYPEYEATTRGYKCRLYIEVPLRQGWGWMHKEDGAGFEEMGSYNKTTNEWEADVDNDEKSGYTNALRRAAQDAWGIGRYLYNKGIPGFLDPNAEAGATHVEPPKPEPPRREINSRPRDVTGINEAPVAALELTQAQSRYGPEYFRLPKPGQAYRWCKNMEAIFETPLVKVMTEEASRNDFGTQFNAWNETQTKAVCLSAIRRIATMPTYSGQFADLLAEGAGPAPKPSPTTAGVHVADLRNEIMTKLAALIRKQTGNEADNKAMKAMFLEIAPKCKTLSGYVGEVPESLAGTADAVWLRNVITFLDDQIAHVATAPTIAGEAA